MTKVGLLLLAVVAIQAAALVLCLTPARLALFRGRWLWPIVALLVIEAAAASSLLLGAYAETRWQMISRLSQELTAADTPSERPLDADRGPALAALLREQSSRLPRPDFSSRSRFEAWQAGLHRRLVDDVFEIPDIEVDREVSHEARPPDLLESGIARTLVTLRGFDDAAIPAYLFVPPGARSRPAIVVIPGHVPEGESGLDQLAGFVESYQRGAALRLAEAGFVTLAIELRGFGRLGAPFHTEHRLVAYNAILAGTFYKAVIARDVKRAVDYLRTRPEVDPERIGITGASYGGELAVTHAALDRRIKVVVFHSFGGSVGPFPPAFGTREDQPHYGRVIPGANAILRREDIFLLLAPRATLGVRGDEYSFRDPEFGAVLERGWRAAGARDSLELRTLPGGYEFFVTPAVEFFRAHL